MRINRRTTALTTATAVIIAGAAFGLHAAFGGSGDDVTHTADAFLSAWQKGDLDAAAGLTTDPDEAKSELLAYRQQLGVTSLRLVPGRVDGDDVAFRTTARISYSGVRVNWTYGSRLTVTRTPAGAGRVAWHSSVLNPALPDGGGYALKSSAGPDASVITDQHGARIDAHDHPGLRGVLDELRQRYGGSAQHAITIRISSEGDGAGGRVVATPGEGGSSHLPTRLDAGTQKSVDTAVAGRPGTSVVVIRPSTGDILATTTSGDSEFNPTLEGVQAPGQVFELVTTAALLDHGAVTATTSVGCPGDTTVAGHAFTSPGGWTSPGASFTEVFAHACDTGFAQLSERLSGQQFADEAKNTFGLDQDWHTGVTTADGALPVLTGGDKAAAAVGQGEVRLNALNLASITATIDNGSFRQPLFVSPRVSGLSTAHAGHALPSRTAEGLRALMRAYAVANGTEGAAFGGVAEQFSDSAVPVVGWYTAFDGDLAIAATAPEQTHRPENARAVVRTVLRANVS